MRKDGSGKMNARLPQTTIAQKVSMCIQVALGMEHLANNQLVHRDLAARNVLLSANLDLKIANMALCRDVYASEYFQFHQQLIPLRWTSPEAILEDEYSNKSDVWSFGVFAWEVFTFADVPYRHKTDDEILKELKLGINYLDCPPLCPADIWNTIQRCVTENPHDRPLFSEIVHVLGDIRTDSIL